MKAKRAFSLLEIILTLLILTLVAGFVGVQAKKVLGDRQFAASSDNLYNLCKMGQWLSLSHQDEIELKIRKGTNGYTASLVSHSPLPVLKNFEKVSLKGIDQIHDQIGSGLDIIFSARADATPSRIYVLTRGDEKKYINISRSYLVTTRSQKEILLDAPFENPLAASPMKK